MAIGDLSSNAKGSGARFNDGKPAMELLPLRETATFLGGIGDHTDDIQLLMALTYIAAFQEGKDMAVYKAMKAMGNPLDSLAECARVLDYGRMKYAEWNWAKGMSWSVVIGCAVRHILKMMEGEGIDQESGLTHRGHVMCNLMFLATYLRVYKEGDDRPKAQLGEGSA